MCFCWVLLNHLCRCHHLSLVPQLPRPAASRRHPQEWRERRVEERERERGVAEEASSAPGVRAWLHNINAHDMLLSM